MGKQLRMPEPPAAQASGFDGMGNGRSKQLRGGIVSENARPVTVQQDMRQVRASYPGTSGGTKSKQLGIPVQDDTLIGGFANLGDSSEDVAKRLLENHKQVMSRGKDRAREVEDKFGGLMNPFEGFGKDDGLSF